ncbi:MAG: hypothetical protein JW993_04980 [Sedimentisphaerales bacterium]|nr:hypothetical protein [Sedimentisphaerales bacterium]
MEHVVADRKKSILAAGLVAIMAIMWVRVLTGQKPKPGAAASVQPPAAQGAELPSVKLRFLELPRIEGRNDCIRRDFFSAQALTGFRRDSTPHSTSTDTEVRTGTSQQNQEVVARVAQKLRVEAVLEGPRAFIDDRLVGVGETLTVKEGTATYVFEVVRIHDDSVLVRCKGQEVTLKLASTRDAIH